MMALARSSQGHTYSMEETSPTRTQARALVSLFVIVLLTNAATVFVHDRVFTLVVAPICLLALCGLFLMLSRAGKPPDDRGRFAREWCQPRWWRTEVAGRTDWNTAVVNAVIAAVAIAWIAAQMLYVIRLAN